MARVSAEGYVRPFGKGEADITIEAAGLTQIASKLALLAVWGLVTVMIGLKVFRWQ